MWKGLLILVFIFSVSSCGHMVRSGQYIEWSEHDDVEKVAQEFQTSAKAIKQANSETSFRAGEWVFIPTTDGMMGPRLARSPASLIGTQAHIDSGDFAWPVPSSKRISSGFGRRWGRKHEGIDIPARIGAHILAAKDGTVVHAGGMGGYGKIIVISHGDSLFSVYAHNNKNFVGAGDKVHQGQVIGQVGNSGRSTGPHLHFEIRHDSQALDPKRIVSRE
jgi:murein DD-endopeptidase MepM/ murein hydrolase activator NlpD